MPSFVERFDADMTAQDSQRREQIRVTMAAQAGTEPFLNTVQLFELASGIVSLETTEAHPELPRFKAKDMLLAQNYLNYREAHIHDRQITPTASPTHRAPYNVNCDPAYDDITRVYEQQKRAADSVAEMSPEHIKAFAELDLCRQDNSLSTKSTGDFFEHEQKQVLNMLVGALEAALTSDDAEQDEDNRTITLESTAYDNTTYVVRSIDHGEHGKIYTISREPDALLYNNNVPPESSELYTLIHTPAHLHLSGETMAGEPLAMDGIAALDLMASLRQRLHAKQTS